MLCLFWPGAESHLPLPLHANAGGAASIRTSARAVIGIAANAIFMAVLHYRDGKSNLAFNHINEDKSKALH
jgi:hypothetical protein